MIISVRYNILSKQIDSVAFIYIFMRRGLFRITPDKKRGEQKKKVDEKLSEYSQRKTEKAKKR